MDASVTRCVSAEVWGLMRRVSCLRAEALRLCGALQEASCEGAEAAWAELLAAAAARAPLDRLLALHLRALERHSVHAMIHDSTQVAYIALSTSVVRVLCTMDGLAAS